MTSPLSPETRAFLKAHGQRSGDARFSQNGWEEWREAFTRGRWRVLPRTDGKYAVTCIGAPNDHEAFGVFGDARAALLEVERRAAGDGEEIVEAAE